MHRRPDFLQMAIELLQGRGRRSSRPLVGVPVLFANGLFQGQFATGPVDDDPDVDRVGGFGGRAEYEMQAEGVAASHLGMI